jgi:hypothetical protein
MELFDITFNKANIYETLFFNIKCVSEFKSVFEFQKQKPELFKQWELIADAKYGLKKISMQDDSYMMVLNDHYVEKAIYYPEFSKIIAITYATVESVEGKGLVRNLKKIVNDDEFIVVKTFHAVLEQISRDGVNSTPQYFPTLCGHNIISNDIPLFIKRLILHRDNFENKTNLIPLILKKHLKSKPWDANVIDTINMWKFNGVSNTPITMISDFLDLKRNADLMQMDELSKYYWNNIETNQKETLDFISLQSANQTNLIIQLINEMRHL